MSIVKKYYVEKSDDGRDLFIVAECEESEFEEENPCFITKKIIDTMVVKNSGVNHGYSGTGPRTLAELIAEDVCGVLIYESKVHKKIIKNILEFIKDYDKEAKFELTSIRLREIINYGEIETYKFLNYDQYFKSLFETTDKLGLTKVNELEFLSRIHMPYSITITKDEISFRNREYEKLGILEFNKMKQDGMPDIKTKIKQHIINNITTNVSWYDTVKDGVLIYLYNDSTSPWFSRKCFIDYLVKFNEIINVFTNNSYYPSWVDENNLPTIEDAWGR